MHLSVVVPTLNEAENIAPLIRFLKRSAPPESEIIVVDGGSMDGTPDLAKKSGAKVISKAPCGRSCQMNLGATIAKGEVLYFVHADVLPPESWANDIADSFSKNIKAGCFSYRFNSKRKLLKINSWATRRNSFLSGGGDQTLFIEKSIFEKMGGFRNDLCIMEDFEFVWRLKKDFPFTVIPNDAIVSARKYEKNGYLKVQVINLLTVFFFKIGWEPERLKLFYKKALG